MDSTAKTDFHSKGLNWSDVKAHVDREHSRYSNKNIHLDRSKYNFQGYILNSKSVNDKYYLPFILLQNIRKVSTGHKDEIYQSVSDYFRQRGLSNQRNSIFEIANAPTRKKYYKILKKRHPNLKNDDIRLIEARSLVDDVKEYHANSCQSVGGFAVNVDESTAHIHFQNLSYPNPHKLSKVGGTKPVNLMPRGKKWKRKTKQLLLKLGHKPKEVNALMKQKKLMIYAPSTSFNNTWRLEFPNAKNAKGQFDSRKALHMAHSKYDPMIIHNFNNELQRAGIHDFKLHLVRRPDRINNLNYPDFIKTQKANSKLKKANESLRANSRSITSSAVADAAPMIKSKVIEKTSEAKNEANQSASTSASVAVSSANASNLSAIWIWRQSASASLSISASSSAKAKTSASMSAVAFSASFVSSASNDLVTKKTNILKECYPDAEMGNKPFTNSQYISCAANGATINNKHVTGYQLASMGIHSMSDDVNKKKSNYNYWKSSANSIHANYNNWSTRASSISSASSFASSALSNANSIHDNTRSMMTDTLMTYDYGYKNTPKFYQFRNYANSSDKSLFSRFKDTVKHVIHKAKATIEKYVMPNHYAKELMYSFLNYYDPRYSNHNYTDKDGNPLPDAHTIKDTNKLQDTFNTEIQIVHNQRQTDLEHNKNLGKPWTPPI